MNLPFVLFKPKLSHLSKNERDVLVLLIEAGKLIVPIYQLQENHSLPGANFYPENITKKDILKAAKDDPEILSPYTVVEKNNDKLVAVPYHDKYKKLLEPVANKLVEASKVTENKEFAQRLKMQAQALMDGTYNKATASWMSMKPYVLDINIGPVERYDDKLLFTKTSYQAWVGVMDQEATERFNKYSTIILGARRKTLMSSERVDYYGKVQTRIDDAVLFSGLIARTLFVGVNLPNDTEMVEKCGSEITIFKQTNHLRHKANLVIFKEIFDPQFQKQFTQADLENGSLYLTALHELAHTYLRFKGAEKRLEDLFPIIDELAATVLGFRVCGSLFLKDITTEKQLEAMMLSGLLRSFRYVLSRQDDRSIYHYTKGGAIFINYLLGSGALKEVGGVSWPNFTKIFMSLSELASILERLLSQGTYRDAGVFIEKYGNYQNLQHFKQ